MTPAKNFELKELSKVFHNIESAKNKLLGADPNLERSMTIYQGIEKTLIASFKTRRQALFKLLLICSFRKKQNILILNVFNVLNYSALNRY